jgi:iron(III) transport system substrate-binding protein
MRIQLRLAAAVLAACSLLLTACGGSPSGAAGTAVATGGLDNLIAAAKEEGTLTWYTGAAPQDADTIAKAFQTKYGIAVEVVRLSSGPIAQRISTEATSNRVSVDVALGTDPVFLDSAAQQGWLAKLHSDEVPSLQSWPAQYRTDTYVTIMVGPLLGVAYNTSLVNGSPPCTWDALLEPRFAGKIVLTNPASSAAYTKFFDVVLHDPRLGEGWITKFRDAGFATVADSAVPAGQLLGAGEGTVSIVSSLPAVSPLSEMGAPVAFCPLDNPAPANLQYLAIVNNAPHPNAARLFFDYFVSVEGQTAYVASAKGASVLGDLPGGVKLPTGLVIPDAKQAQDDLPRIQILLGVK